MTWEPTDNEVRAAAEVIAEGMDGSSWSHSWSYWRGLAEAALIAAHEVKDRELLQNLEAASQEDTIDQLARQGFLGGQR